VGYVSLVVYLCKLTRRADGLSRIVRNEGPVGLTRGTSLALVGVGNGAIQFVVYEKMKAWGFERKRRQAQQAGREYNANTDKLVRSCLFLHTLRPKFFP